MAGSWQKSPQRVTYNKSVLITPLHNLAFLRKLWATWGSKTGLDCVDILCLSRITAHCHVYEITNSAESKNAEDTGMFLVVSQLNPFAMDKFGGEANGYHIFLVNMLYKLQGCLHYIWWIILPSLPIIIHWTCQAEVNVHVSELTPPPRHATHIILSS